MKRVIFIETYDCSNKKCKNKSWVRGGGLCNKCLFELGMKKLKEDDNKNDRIRDKS